MLENCVFIKIKPTRNFYCEVEDGPRHNVPRNKNKITLYKESLN